MTKRGKKRLFVLAGLTAIAGAAAGGAYVVHRAQVARIMERGLTEGTAAFEAKDYALALERLNDYASRSQDDPNVMLMMAKARREVPLANGRHIVRAVSFAMAAAAAAPGDPRPYEILIDLYGEMNQAGERVRAAEDLLKIDPDNEAAMLARAETLAHMGRTADALDQARALTEKHPESVRATAITAELMLASGDPGQEARALVDRAVQAHPENIDFALVRASVYATMHEPEEAMAEARRATTLAAASPEQIDRVVGLLDRLGLDSEADAYLRKQSEGLEPGSTLSVLAAERAWMAGDVDSARDHLLAVLTNPQEHTDDAIGWAAFLANAAKAPDAASAVEAELRARETLRAKAWSRIIDGMSRLAAGDAASARDALAEALDYSRRDRVATALLGEAYGALGDTDRAVTLWEGLVRERPRWLTVRVSLVNALLRRGRIDDAHQQAAATWTLWRDRLVTSSLLARTSVSMVEAGRASDALKRDAQTLVTGLQQEPTVRGEATSLLARLYAATGQADKAQAAVDEVIRGEAVPSPADILALADLCRAHGLQGVDKLISIADAQSASNPDIALASARRSAAAGRADEGKALLRDGLAKAAGPAKRNWERRLAVFLDEIDDPEGIAMLKAAAVEHARDAATQIDLLTSRGAWRDEPLISAAIGRLKDIVGDTSLSWRVYEARRLITFTPTDDRAARAIETLTPVLRENPEHVGALVLAAEAYQRISPPNNERSAEMLARAADADPAQPILRARHIALLQQMGRSEEAGRRLRDLATLNTPDPTIRRARADLFVRQGMWAEAAADLKAIADSGDLAAVVALAGVQAKQGNMAGAKLTLAQVLQAADPSVAVLANAAQLHAQIGDIAAGEAVLARLPSSLSADMRAIAQAQFYESASDFSRAEQVFKNAIAAAPTGDLLAEWAAWLTRRGRFDEAEKVITDASATYPNHDALEQAGQLLRLARSGGDPEALAKAGGSDPAIIALADASKSFKESGDRSAYTIRLSAIRDQYPTSLAVRRELLRALQDAGDVARVEQEAIAAAAAIPTSDQAARLAAEALAQIGRLDNALSMTREWRRRSLEAPADAEIAMGQIEAMLNRPQDAIATFEKWKQKIIDSAESAPQPLIVYARQLAIVGRADEADALLRPRAEKSSYWATAYAAVGRVLVGNPDSARAWLERAAPLAASDTQARLLLGQAWFDLAGRTRDTADYRKVVDALNGLESKEPAAAGLLLATTHDLLGNIADAERCYRLAIGALPDNPAALNNFAYFLIKTGGAPSEAEALAERAVSAAQREGITGAILGGMIHTLAEARLKGGRFPEAEQAFNRGLAADPANPHLLLGLVETHIATARLDDAAAGMQRLDAALRAGLPDDQDFKDRLEKARQTLAAR